jgi:mRNA interferase HigB
LRVITIRRIREFIEKHPDSEPMLLAWHTAIRGGTWRNFPDLKNTFGSADLVGRRTVFDVMNNRYRLIARVNYRTKKVFVLDILTHKEYDKGNWKK